MFRITLVFIVISSWAYCVESLPFKESPLSQLEDLILSTEKLAQQQKELKNNLTEYLKWHDIYLKDPDNRELLLKAAKLAKQSLEVIKEQQLNYLFEPSFISEMTLFAKLANRPTIKYQDGNKIH